jgi:hypothetical protein
MPRGFEGGAAKRAKTEVPDAKASSPIRLVKKTPKFVDVRVKDEKETDQVIQETRERLGLTTETATTEEGELTTAKPEAKFIRQTRAHLRKPAEERIDVELEEELDGPPIELQAEMRKDMPSRKAYERIMREGNGMTIKGAKKLVPNAARIWDIINARLRADRDPSEHLALSAQDRRFFQQTDLPTNFVFLLAKYLEALKENDTAHANELEVDVFEVGEMFELMPLIREARAVISVPYVEFTPNPKAVIEKDAKAEEEERLAKFMNGRRAKEVLGSTYNMVGKVNGLLSTHPQAIPLLKAESQEYFPQPTEAESLMFAMAKYLNAMDRGDADAATEEAHVRELADAVGLSGDAQFEDAMRRPAGKGNVVGEIRPREERRQEAA